MAGALAHCGSDVPQAIRANATNPAGFYEPRWVVDFHKEQLERAGVRTLDTDPDALARMEAVTGDAQVRDTLRSWLAARLEEHDRLVLKDPRMVWFRDLWVAVAHDLGLDPAFVVMLRHPSEVSSSRSEFYNVEEVTGVAGWIDVALMTERLTRESPRALVLYPRLTADWRGELVRLRGLLDLHLDPAPEQTPHPADDFIDPALRRREPGWDDARVPSYLTGLADEVFAALDELTTGAGETGPDLAARLDGLGERYATLHAEALALTSHHLKRVKEQTRRRTARRLRQGSGS